MVYGYEYDCRRHSSQIYCLLFDFKTTKPIEVHGDHTPNLKRDTGPHVIIFFTSKKQLNRNLMMASEAGCNDIVCHSFGSFMLLLFVNETWIWSGQAANSTVEVSWERCNIMHTWSDKVWEPNIIILIPVETDAEICLLPDQRNFRQKWYNDNRKKKNYIVGASGSRKHVGKQPTSESRMCKRVN